MLGLIERYTEREAGNLLAVYLPALREVDGTDSHEGLDPGFTRDWVRSASVEAFRRMQRDERDRVYFDPAVRIAKDDGLRTLGQFAYYDAYVMHGEGDDDASFGGIRRAARAKAQPPARGGDEVAYLSAFLDARVRAMKREEAHSDTSRVDTAQRVFLREGNMDQGRSMATASTSADTARPRCAHAACPTVRARRPREVRAHSRAGCVRAPSGQWATGRAIGSLGCSPSAASAPGFASGVRPQWLKARFRTIATTQPVEMPESRTTSRSSGKAW